MSREDRAGEDLDLQVGEGRCRGYRSAPAAGRGIGVLVLHEAWGLVDSVRDVCDRLARGGFVALAPDLFDGETASDEASAVGLISKLSSEGVGADLDAAVQALLNDPAVDGPKIGCLGFCAGGHLALFAAARSSRVGAIADCYGFLPGFPVELDGMAAPFLGVFGEADEYISADAVAELEGRLEDAGVRADCHRFPAVGHGFMNEDRPDRYDASAALRAWDLIASFLRAELS